MRYQKKNGDLFLQNTLMKSLLLVIYFIIFFNNEIIENQKLLSDFNWNFINNFYFFFLM